MEGTKNKFAKIWKFPNSKTVGTSLKSDWEYLDCKFPKITIEK